MGRANQASFTEFTDDFLPKRGKAHLCLPVQREYIAGNNRHCALETRS